MQNGNVAGSQCICELGIAQDHTRSVWIHRNCVDKITLQIESSTRRAASESSHCNYSSCLHMCSCARNHKCGKTNNL